VSRLTGSAAFELDSAGSCAGSEKFVAQRSFFNVAASPFQVSTSRRAEKRALRYKTFLECGSLLPLSLSELARGHRIAFDGHQAGLIKAAADAAALQSSMLKRKRWSRGVATANAFLAVGSLVAGSRGQCFSDRGLFPWSLYRNVRF
jgi:hypothetical protein